MSKIFSDPIRVIVISAVAAVRDNLVAELLDSKYPTFAVESGETVDEIMNRCTAATVQASEVILFNLNTDGLSPAECQRQFDCFLAFVKQFQRTPTLIMTGNDLDIDTFYRLVVASGDNICIPSDLVKSHLALFIVKTLARSRQKQDPELRITETYRIIEELKITLRLK